MYIGVRDVKPLANYRLLLSFDNGEKRVFDVRPYLNKGVFSQLRDVAVFNSVRVSFDTVEWSNGADLCPETLYRDSVEATKADLAAV
jgi:hypothetical protein